MKHHPLKTIIPLVLIVALLIAACWFFLFHRPDLTSGALVYWADHFEQEGRYNRAITLYTAAAKLQPHDDRIPRWLARAYIADGNYTKAEYTLVGAITEIPDSVELYCELSRTYLAQDKLLDAERMLGRITDNTVRAEIERLRPAAPVLTPESGYYSEYITVSAYAASGQIYLTTDGAFPSLDADAYAAPVTLSGGENTVTAISVDQNGLVSSVVYGGYTIGNVVEPVTLRDAVLDGYVRELLGKSASDTIMTDELWEIQELALPDGVSSLDDLPLFTGLLTLSAHQLAGVDLTPIASLTTLRTLDLSGCTLSSSMLELIGTLPELRSLNLSQCAIDSINALVGLTGLEYLNITDNTVSDLTAVSAMTQLEELYISNNPITTITYLSSCPALRILSAESCGIAKLSPLADCTALEELYAANNAIEDISVLSGCTALRVIDISSNTVSDISILPQLPELVNFKANNNQITEIPVFDAETSKLVQFSANYNEITDVSGLAGLIYLNYVRVDYNKVTDVYCLKDNFCLIQVDVWDNPVDTEKFQEMQDLGIIVNYNPNYEPEPDEAAES